MRPIPPPKNPLPLRLPDWPLPPYRYLPGLNPHPFRSPQGHMYTDGSAPVPSPWTPDTPWREDQAYLRGLDLFDQRFYWESHEVWEGIWHQVPKDSSFSLLLQALIQSGAYTIKIHSERPSAAEKLLARIRMRLDGVQAQEGARYRGLALATLLQRLEAFATGGAWPSLRP